jgi:phage protein U
MYAQLGDIRFEGLFGFDTFKGKRAQSLAQHALIDGKPRLQKTGDQLEEIQIDIQLHSRFCDPESVIAQLHSACAGGQIMPLITGAGEFVGDFTISEVGRALNHLDPRGRIIWARVGVNLIEVAAEGVDAVVVAAKSAAFAIARNEPVLVPIDSVPLQGLGISVMSSLGAAGALANSSQINLDNASKAPAQEASLMAKAREQLLGVQASLQTFETQLQAIQDQVSNITQIQSNITAAITYAQNTVEAIDGNDLSGALTASQTLQGGVSNLTGACSGVAVLTAIRRA